ncbi:MULTISPECIES: YqaA family protein [Pseudoalteromonas]|uniref:DedA family protein n=2 Tax=Pseudoalteromonas TaxID=53246 RepID=A0AAD0TZP6_9GAMM|nr:MULTISPECIES: YqaA family protein [Pseudoalteromonas]MAJ39567.1 DedA family protein [Pseudoalteromonadaceae bacterium]MCP4058612.1 DedA family protein [Pseudoalteromonas sp.]MDC9521132.1 DedA family protein [Pseudoalteromonas sp. Angola-31]MDY6887175.1 YqaA family protein [Pseudomonadota bacterium]OUX90115.1 MAG: DedA family protein [Pseudoalteromonas sp. TMED43]
MKLFTKLYDMALVWAKHRFAERYLAAMSFAESVFFPVPPDVMLAPMSLAQPSKAWRFASFATVASVLGGIVGYFLGYWLFEPVVQPFIEQMHWQEKFETALTWFKEYGVWVVFLAGFSPIPYKVFTIGAGVLQMAFLPFLIASAVGRGARFFLVSALMKWGGVKMEQKLRQYVEVLGWGLVILIAVAYFLLR